jgi:hypothetical protein
MDCAPFSCSSKIRYESHTKSRLNIAALQKGFENKITGRTLTEFEEGVRNKKCLKQCNLIYYIFK